MSQAARKSSIPRLAACALCLAAACGEKIQEQYQIQIIGPADTNYLAGVKTMVMDVGGKEVARTDIVEGRAFSLVGAGIDTTMTTSGSMRLRGLGPTGELVIYGQTPEMELLLASLPIVTVFVQKPGTFGRTVPLPLPRKNLVAVSSSAAPSTVFKVPISVVFYGLGEVTLPDAMTMVPTDKPSEVLEIYNPLIHDVDGPWTAGASAGGVHAPRTEAAALARPDGTILMFGGMATPPMMPPRPSAQLDLVRLVRADFDFFDRVQAVRDTDTAGVARVRPVLADADFPYAFGGVADDAPLDTVVAIDPSMPTAFRILDKKMSGPRDGHTATTVSVGGVPEILVFGGGADTTAVAEVFIPGATPRFETRMGSPGTQRRDHAALVLPANDIVLIVGGRDNAGAARGDSVLYRARTGMFADGPITLKTPRSKFAAFIVGNDLVVAGGLDAQGAPIGNAEVFDASTDALAAKAVVPCFARSRPAVAILPNQSVVLLGGTLADGHGTTMIEIYQPLR